MRHIVPLLLIVTLISCKDSTNHKAPLAGKHLQKAVIWNMEIDSATQKFKIEPLRTVMVDTITPALLIKNLNGIWGHVQAEVSNTRNDTIVIKIPNSTYLTQQMGSSGPLMYLGSTTYTLTELKGINYVRFDFKEGDHAAPGTYCKADFDSSKIN
jgi:hypothetical protein